MHDFIWYMLLEGLLIGKYPAASAIARIKYTFFAFV